MNWEEVEQILYNMHCRACDGYGCDHGDKVAEALVALKELAAQQSVQQTVTKQAAVTPRPAPKLSRGRKVSS